VGGDKGKATPEVIDYIDREQTWDGGGGAYNNYLEQWKKGVELREQKKVGKKLH